MEATFFRVAAGIQEHDKLEYLLYFLRGVLQYWRIMWLALKFLAVRLTKFNIDLFGTWVHHCVGVWNKFLFVFGNSA